MIHKFSEEELAAMPREELIKMARRFNDLARTLHGRMEDMELTISAFRCSRFMTEEQKGNLREEMNSRIRWQESLGVCEPFNWEMDEEYQKRIRAQEQKNDE